MRQQRAHEDEVVREAEAGAARIAIRDDAVDPELGHAESDGSRVDVAGGHRAGIEAAGQPSRDAPVAGREIETRPDVAP
jgi:hypothetical protein